MITVTTGTVVAGATVITGTTIMNGGQNRWWRHDDGYHRGWDGVKRMNAVIGKAGAIATIASRAAGANASSLSLLLE